MKAAALHLAIAILSLLSSSAFADVTVCDGDKCTVVTGGGSRQMTPEEVRSHKREQSRDRLYDVDCSVADDPLVCRAAIETALENLGR
jgi:hypothetical protein